MFILIIGRLWVYKHYFANIIWNIYIYNNSRSKVIHIHKNKKKHVWSKCADKYLLCIIMHHFYKYHQLFLLSTTIYVYNYFLPNKYANLSNILYWRILMKRTSRKKIEINYIYKKQNFQLFWANLTKCTLTYNMAELTL